MLLTKFDLYKSEWLDLVFTNRNKSYGAYELRQSYGKTMSKAMGIAFTTVVAAILIIAFTKQNVVKEIPVIVDGPETLVDFTKIKPPVEPEKSVEPAKPEQEKPAGAKPDLKTAAIPIAVTNDDSKAVDPSTVDELNKSVISTENNPNGQETTGNVPEGAGNEAGGKGEGSGTGKDDMEVHGTFETMERMPEPVGGQQAWTKFLQRNLRFPSVAQDQGVNGRVFISFIIEKDGKLSDITILRGGEHGFGEEALRVLKKAAAWTPGIQNGRPVRVKYVIPINFQLPE
ncbi:MAG: energy transducer TonB [Sphingobacteriaceae bacterium]|nr:MAG: energy transducer TonB [Sphingobacteriaceae bacterium]